MADKSAKWPQVRFGALSLQRTHEERASLGIGVNQGVFRVFPGYWFADVVANGSLPG